MDYQLIEDLYQAILKDYGFQDGASYPLKGKEITASILLKTPGRVVISGIELLQEVAKKFSLELKTTWKSSEVIQECGTVAYLTGDACAVLACERTFLNLLSFMSAIATKTFEFSEALSKTGKKTKIAATRKTLLFLNHFQKLAVLQGGGDTHRLNLSEMAMIKDNHRVLYGNLENAIKEVKKGLSFSKKLEVEVESENEALLAAKWGADIIMLDNMSPEEAIRVATLIKMSFPYVLVEASGGIRRETFLAYAHDNIDIISTGTLTTEITYIDYSLEIL